MVPSLRFSKNNKSVEDKKENLKCNGTVIAVDVKAKKKSSNEFHSYELLLKLLKTERNNIYAEFRFYKSILRVGIQEVRICLDLLRDIVRKTFDLLSTVLSTNGEWSTINTNEDPVVKLEIEKDDEEEPIINELFHSFIKPKLDAYHSQSQVFMSILQFNLNLFNFGNLLMVVFRVIKLASAHLSRIFSRNNGQSDATNNENEERRNQNSTISVSRDRNLSFIDRILGSRRSEIKEIARPEANNVEPTNFQSTAASASENNGGAISETISPDSSSANELNVADTERTYQSSENNVNIPCESRNGIAGRIHTTFDGEDDVGMLEAKNNQRMDNAETNIINRSRRSSSKNANGNDATNLKTEKTCPAFANGSNAVARSRRMCLTIPNSGDVVISSKTGETHSTSLHENIDATRLKSRRKCIARESGNGIAIVEAKNKPKMDNTETNIVSRSIRDSSTDASRNDDATNWETEKPYPHLNRSIGTRSRSGRPMVAIPNSGDVVISSKTRKISPSLHHLKKRKRTKTKRGISHSKRRRKIKTKCTPDTSQRNQLAASRVKITTTTKQPATKQPATKQPARFGKELNNDQKRENKGGQKRHLSVENHKDSLGPGKKRQKKR